MNFNTLLENQIAITKADYKGEDDTSPESRRLLSFGPRKDGLTPAIDLDTLSPKDIATLTKEEYLERAWEEPTPDRKWHALRNIINMKEGGEEGEDIFFNSADDEEMRHEKIYNPSTGKREYGPERLVNKGSYRTFKTEDLDKDGYIVFKNLGRLKNVLKQLHDHDDELTFSNLSDEYLTKASVSDEPIRFEPEKDIDYGEMEDGVKSSIDDDEPIDIDDIKDTKAEVEPEPEVEVSATFEPETDIDIGTVDSELEPTPPKPTAKEVPDIDIKPELTEPKKPELPTDIELAIDKAIDKKVDDAVDDAVDDVVKPEPEIEPEIEPELEIEPEPIIEPEELVADGKIRKGPLVIESMINRALHDAGLH